MNDKAPTGGFDLLSLLRAATEAVPATRWAVGVVGLAAAAAIILTVSRDPVFGIAGVVGVLVAMVALFVFSRLVAVAAVATRPAAVVLMWFVVVIFMATVTCLFAAVFFNKPWPLRDRFFASAVAARAESVGLQQVADAVRELSEPALIKLVDFGEASHHVGYFDPDTNTYYMAPIWPEVRELDKHDLIEWTMPPDVFNRVAGKFALDSERGGSIAPTVTMSAEERIILRDYAYRLNGRGRSLYKLLLNTVIKQIKHG